MSKRAALAKKGSSPVYATMIARFKGGGRRNSNADDGPDGIKVGESRPYYTLIMYTRSAMSRWGSVPRRTIMNFKKRNRPVAERAGLGRVIDPFF
jgi:hypothetical protein